MARWAAWWSFGSEVPGGLGVTLNIVWMLHFGPRLIATKRKVAAVCRLKVNAFDEKGEPFHKRGISAESGIYFLGLPNLVNRASSFIYGVWHDAKYVADHIVLQNEYMAYSKP